MRIPCTCTLVHECSKKEIETEFDKELKGLEVAFENGDSLIEKRTKNEFSCNWKNIEVTSIILIARVCMLYNRC